MPRNKLANRAVCKVFQSDSGNQSGLLNSYFHKSSVDNCTFDVAAPCPDPPDPDPEPPDPDLESLDPDSDTPVTWFGTLVLCVDLLWDNSALTLLT